MSCRGRVGSAAPSPNVGDPVESNGAACTCYPANTTCPGECRCDHGHPEYFNLLDELRSLHVAKSGGYGTSHDPMGNFTAVAALTGQPRYLYPVHRSIEKLTRVLSLHGQGRSAELEEEFLDVASLLLCAAAMLRQDV